MDSIKSSKLSLIGAMVIFGSIGIFRRFFPLPSAFIALMRGLIGILFLWVYLKSRKQSIHLQIVKKNLFFLMLSGACMGINWILLFEAYRFTSVATATVCYYMAPIFVTIVSSLFIQKKVQLKTSLSILVSFLGLILTTGIVELKELRISEMKGILLGIGAAAFYASVILMGAKLKEVPSVDKTVFQLIASSLIILPYTLLLEKISLHSFTPIVVFTLLIVGIVHTGIAYVLYFGSMSHLSSTTIALYGYLDPIVAILLSACILGETPSLLGWIGAALILGSTLVNELSQMKK